MTNEEIVKKVRERYGRIAAGQTSGCGCGVATPAAESRVAEEIGYTAQELVGAAAESNLGLGCGAPVAQLELRAGERVLDLGSGGGIDCFIAAQRVGPTGQVIGVDMTPEMIARARASAARAGLTQVEFRQGRLEQLPLGSASVDAVTSNCVINLAPDKAAVFREVARVLVPGGRLVVSDIVLDGELPPAVCEHVLAYVGCLAGAMRREPYFALLDQAGLVGREILQDIDYLAVAACALPEELQQLLRSSGARLEDLAGKVRSITYRAFRPRT